MISGGGAFRADFLGSWFLLLPYVHWKVLEESTGMELEIPFKEVYIII